MAISWREHEERQKKLEKELKELYGLHPLAEMCDVCGWRNNYIYRTIFWYNKVKFVIRHCPYCNPTSKWDEIKSALPKG
jgi:hypothetical protein